MLAAAPVSSPSDSPTCSRTRSASIPTPRCLQKVIDSPKNEASRTSAGSKPEPKISLAPGTYRVITFGQSFHWTDEARVAEVVYDMLEPGGTLALIVHTVESRPEPPNPGAPPIPHAEIKALVGKYLGSAQRAGRGIAPVRTHRFQDVLVRTRFDAPRSTFAPGIPNLLRDSESVLSGYFSMSSSAPHLFGQRAEDFAAEIRAMLKVRSPQGIFWDWPGDTEVILARRPS